MRFLFLLIESSQFPQNFTSNHFPPVFDVKSNSRHLQWRNKSVCNVSSFCTLFFLLRHYLKRLLNWILSVSFKSCWGLKWAIIIFIKLCITLKHMYPWLNQLQHCFEGHNLIQSHLHSHGFKSMYLVGKYFYIYVSNASRSVIIQIWVSMFFLS